MGKYLFFNVPAYGHVNPTLPIITELVGQGHSVITYNASTFAPILAPTHATFRAYPNSGEMETELTRRAVNLPTVTAKLLQESLRLIPFALKEIEEEQPDKVLFDALALWGMQAAVLQGVPTVSSITTFFMEGVKGMLTWRDTAYLVRHAFHQLPKILSGRRALVKTYGTAVFPQKFILPAIGNDNLLYTSRAFHPESPLLDGSFHFVGPSISAHSRGNRSFPWEKLDPSLPKIYLSLGTIYNAQPEFYTAVFNHFRTYPAQFIVSIGKQIKKEQLSDVPANFIVQSSVPQLALLPKIDLFISHGGMNSINESLAFGVPLLILPQQIEQAINGRFVAQKGAGLILSDAPPYGRIQTNALQQTIDHMLNTPLYRHNAEAVAQSFKASGGINQAIQTITTPSTT